MSRSEKDRANLPQRRRDGVRFLGLVWLALAAACSALPSNLRLIKELHHPEGTQDSRDRRVQSQPQKIYRLFDESLWISTDFEGGRLADVRRSGADVELHCRPENSPINNSPWYAFQLWSTERRKVRLLLRYFNGTHRYAPWISNDGSSWRKLSSSNHRVLDKQRLEITLTASAKKIWIAAQPLFTNQHMERWLQELAVRSHTRVSVVGHSHGGRPIHRLTLGAKERPRVVILGRTHPPEVTGTLALVSFVEALSGADPLARRFRERFTTWVFPLLNPDGVAAGHWRHNGRGVDLNRDWRHFLQRENRIIRDQLMPMKGQLAFALDFHSTSKDIFYILDPTAAPRLHRRVRAWLVRVAKALPACTLTVQPIAADAPGAATWLSMTLGTPAVTYEAGDRTDRQALKERARAAATALMKTLLEPTPN